MPILRGYVFGTSKHNVLVDLFVFAPVAQQVLITAAHKSEAALHQANGAASKIMGFPGAFGNVLKTEQNLRDRAV